VIAAPGQRALLAEVETSPPIGTHLSCKRRSTTIALAPDCVVAFYTDGLIERRGEFQRATRVAATTAARSLVSFAGRACLPLN
jgi:hypothetical protein